MTTTYQNPAFFFYHSYREGTLPTTTPVESTQSVFTMFDGRQGEVFAFTADLDAGDKVINGDRDGSAESALLDTLFVAGHNCNGVQVRVRSNEVNLSSPDTIDVPNGELFQHTFTPNNDDPDLEVRFSGGGVVKPEFTELMLTRKRELTSGPRFDFGLPWLRTQERFTSAAGVTSTQLRGPARKTYSLTWERLTGDDLQIMLDLRTQTADWSQPFYFQPPTDTEPTILVEVDRDPGFTQDFENPLGGTSNEVRLDMIAALG